ncbi:D-ribose pyranase [Edwardsiella hoshinae]|uniref:D-ribose pyranase n=1 Tax=Edwardsiella hoshinae TaxID=93378 RepID=A0A376DNH9_9GAMM|nr:D-ribose pyranase [Edwardsiella hoshinae]AOV98438.1 D-ribose pyranase [Edwardsiella hoshinae]QPR28710.1 D-ribose pyranase [Edwardsiella hoshinae]STC92385.1 D-ribose pyranase [Edwardsiella hoshinae]
MKKGTVLNSEVSALVARLGHTDSVTIGDAGLPIPNGVVRIDLALTHDVPRFMQVVETVTTEMQVERAVLAQEMAQSNPDVYQQLLAWLQLLAQRQGNNIQIDYVTHNQFKVLSGESKAVIRSGECSPYANVLLYAGVTF